MIVNSGTCYLLLFIMNYFKHQSLLRRGELCLSESEVLVSFMVDAFDINIYHLKTIISGYICCYVL